MNLNLTDDEHWFLVEAVSFLIEDDGERYLSDDPGGTYWLYEIKPELEKLLKKLEGYGSK